jgi:acetolactate synthase small subunit
MPPWCATDADVDFPAALFSVQARAEPGVMPRVLELFAKRGLVPTRWYSTIAGSAPKAEPKGPALTIEIAVAGLDAEVSLYIAACLRQIADVETVRTGVS